jgi:hypothetical protein
VSTRAPYIWKYNHNNYVIFVHFDFTFLFLLRLQVSVSHKYHILHYIQESFTSWSFFHVSIATNCQPFPWSTNLSNAVRHERAASVYFTVSCLFVSIRFVSDMCSVVYYIKGTVYEYFCVLFVGHSVKRRPRIIMR